MANHTFRPDSAKAMNKPAMMPVAMPVSVPDRQIVTTTVNITSTHTEYFKIVRILITREEVSKNATTLAPPNMTIVDNMIFTFC